MIFICLSVWFFDNPLQAQSLPGKEITITTRDNHSIAATIGGIDHRGSKPAIILIHQGGSDRQEWNGFYQRLLDSGYVVLAYDVRGHGKSTPVEEVSQLFNDPQKAPRDLQAVLDYLSAQSGVDGQRIAIVGASIGGNLAAVAAGKAEYRVKSAVVISAKTSAVYNLAGVNPGQLHLQTVYYIASSLEQQGARAKWARELYESTTEPRRLQIVEGSQKHGVYIMEDDPALAGGILRWLQETL